MMAAVLLIYFIKNDAERNFIHIAFMLSCLGLASLLPYIYRKVIKKKKTKLAEMNKEDRTKEIESIKKIEKNTLIIMGASLMVVIIWLILLLQYSTII
jgi:p-aminobenzoyl-glutamate transporter AbgT